MNAPKAPKTWYRLGIRNWMVLNLHLAVLLGGIYFIAKAGGIGLTDDSMAIMLGIPLILAFLSAMTLKPGARRDFFSHFFFAVGGLVLAAWTSVPILAVGQFIFDDLSRLSHLDRLTRSEWSTVALLPAICWLGTLNLICGCLPRRCPVCCHISLIKARMSRPVRSPEYEYYWCAACETRCKRRRQPPLAWDNVSSSEDDPYYWMGTIGSWLHRPQHPR